MLPSVAARARGTRVWRRCGFRVCVRDHMHARVLLVVRTLRLLVMMDTVCPAVPGRLRVCWWYRECRELRHRGLLLPAGLLQPNLGHLPCRALRSGCVREHIHVVRLRGPVRRGWSLVSAGVKRVHESVLGGLFWGCGDIQPQHERALRGSLHVCARLLLPARVLVAARRAGEIARPCWRRDGERV